LKLVRTTGKKSGLFFCFFFTFAAIIRITENNCF
jgi:hypothetical protein